MKRRNILVILTMELNEIRIDCLHKLVETLRLYGYEAGLNIATGQIELYGIVGEVPCR